jgi:ankyrin repeat protein
VENNTSELLLLLQRGADPNARIYKGVTALMWAAAHKNRKAVAALIAHGADIKATNDAGTNVMGYALSPVKGDADPKIIEMLKKAGASEAFSWGEPISLK